MQTDNSDIASKILIRKAAIKEEKSPKVLDVCAGEGILYKEVWNKADKYMGIDKRFSREKKKGLCWKGDNSRLLKLAMSQEKWNIIDIDTYVNPWILAQKAIKLIRAKSFIIVFTCGISRGLKNGQTNGYIRKISGTNSLSDTRLLIRWYFDIINWIFEDIKKTRPMKVKFIKYIRSNQNPDVFYWIMKATFI